MEVTRFSIEQSDGVTAVSGYLRDKTIEIFGIKKPVEVIYNFIEEHSDQLKKYTALRHKIAPNGEIILSHLSNFRPVKRVEDVIEIAYRVRQKIPVKVMMIGDGPERSRAEARARELNISEHVHFLGRQDDIYLLLSASDVFLMPSRLESFGLAALEAMACGVPCVSSNSGGLKELVKEGVAGYTAEVGDIERMSQLVLQIVQDPKIREKLSRSSRDYALTNFHVSKIVPQYLDFYKKILAQ